MENGAVSVALVRGVRCRHRHALASHIHAGSLQSIDVVHFLAILGGVYTFGMLGVFYGPLILSFVMVMLQIYAEEYAEDLKDEDELIP